MAPVRGPRFLLCCALFAALSASPAHALRIVDYNLLNYPGSTGAIRDPYYRVVFGPLSADVIVTEEQHSQSGVDEFLNNVLNILEPGQWAAAPFIVGGDSQCGFYYKPSKVQFLGQWGFYPNPANHLRLVNVYRVKPVGYSSTQAEIRLYGLHLKASMGFETQRAAEAAGLRDTLDALPAGVSAFALGDCNFYTGLEPAMDTLLAVRVNNRGRLYDPLGLQSVTWQDNASIAIRHTQCPSTTAYRPQGLGAAGGGLDDRFDLILPTYDLKDGEGVDLLPSTYVSVGNDGFHLNKSVTDQPIAAADTAYARALWECSDHLPVRVDLMLPAQISVSTSPLAFGTVIQGASTPTQSLLVANAAAAPADTLEYSYAAPTGFTAPAGTISLLPSASSNDVLGMDTSTPSALSGTLVVSSNDLDLPTRNVSLSGTVLAHAQPSLDSLAVVLTDSLDFGVEPIGGFSDQLARVHDFGYGALEARLGVTGAAITGPDAARFSIAGGFSPALVAGTAAGWNVHFDDTGATPGDTYTATLTFATADEALPGAVAQASVSFALTAEVATAATAVGGGGIPTTTRLYAPFPNPLHGTSTVRFDLARAADLSLDVFDLSGRRVAKLADGAFPAGAWSVHWNGGLASGRSAGAGLYFVRMSDAARPLATVRLVIVR